MHDDAGPPNDALTPPIDWRSILLAAIALLGMLVLVLLISIQTNTDKARDDALRQQAHSYEVIIRANALTTAIARAEAALGRYVVSADKALGREYSDQWGKAADQITRLRQVIGPGAEQQAQVAALRTAFDARGKELTKTALYSVYKRDRDALGAYYQIRETPALNDLNDKLDAVISSERRVLASRSEAAAASIAQAKTATRVLTAFGVLIVFGAILLGWLTVVAQGERAAADAEAEAERLRAAELEDAVQAATAELRQEAHERELAEAQLRQVQKMEAVGQLTGGIAHDFNNMLAVVLGGLELAKRHLHTGGPHAQRHIENAMEGANRAAALTRRLLTFSRAEPVLPEAVQVGELVAGMSDLLDRTLGDTIEIVTYDDGKPWRAWIDKHQLENAVLNLAVNARDAMDGRGTITITAGTTTLVENAVGECAAGDYAMLAVRDTGSGMSPEVLERVFEPFFTTKPVGKGTAVTIYLPRYVGVQHADEAERSTSGEPGPARGALDILVVEDDPRVLSATVSALTDLGHHPIGCDDPLDVPARLAGIESLDLVVSDVLMPGQTGPEMVAANAEALGGVPVLFVTGYAGEADPTLFGGHTVLRKPYTLAVLARAVQDSVQRGGGPTRHAAE